MGVTCKPEGEFKSLLAKLENEKRRAAEDAKTSKKSAKKSK